MGDPLGVVGTGLKESALRPIIGPQLPPLMARRTAMGDAMTRPQFSAIFELLKPLVFACKPPSAGAGSPPSPHQQPPATTLPALDRDMLTCDAFVRRLMGEITSTKMLNTVKPLVEHLCWEDEDLTGKFVAVIRSIVAKEEYTAALKPSFRALVVLCDVADSKQAARCDAVIGGVLDEMQNNAQYYGATETCVALLMRMAKHHAVVRTWLKEVRSTVGGCWGGGCWLRGWGEWRPCSLSCVATPVLCLTILLRCRCHATPSPFPAVCVAV